MVHVRKSSDVKAHTFSSTVLCCTQQVNCKLFKSFRIQCLCLASIGLILCCVKTNRAVSKYGVLTTEAISIICVHWLDAPLVLSQHNGLRQSAYCVIICQDRAREVIKVTERKWSVGLLIHFTCLQTVTSFVRYNIQFWLVVISIMISVHFNTQFYYLSQWISWYSCLWSHTSITLSLIKGQESL
jgi:hypothetical protein